MITTATTPIENRSENEQIIRLVEVYREQGDERAVESSCDLLAKLVNHLVRLLAGSSGEFSVRDVSHRTVRVLFCK